MDDDLSPEGLAAIRARAVMLRLNLRAMVSDDRRWTLVVDADDCLVAQCVSDDEADVIVHARADILALAAEVERLRAEAESAEVARAELATVVLTMGDENVRLRADLDEARAHAAYHADNESIRRDMLAEVPGYRSIGWTALDDRGRYVIPDSEAVIRRGCSYYGGTPVEVFVLDQPTTDEVFIGSLALIAALHDTYVAHIGVTEPEGPDGPYIWCTCGWRSDELSSGNPGASYAVHLSNAQHAAAVEALQPIVRRVSRHTRPTTTGGEG